MGLNLPFPELLQKIKNKIGPESKICLVGGAIRDCLLKKPVHDLDFLVTGDSAEIARKISKTVSGVSFVLDDKRQTSRVLFNFDKATKLTLDFNTLQFKSILEDLRNRDFTINAIAVDLEQPGKLIDPLHGQTDLENKKLVLCGSASLENDPIRILRAIRFSSSYGFQLSRQVSTAITKSLPSLGNTSGERRRDELFQLLSLPDSLQPIGELDKHGILLLLLPELMGLRECHLSNDRGMNYWDRTLQILHGFDQSREEMFFGPKGDKKEQSSKQLKFAGLDEYREKIQQHFANPIQPERERISLFRFAILCHAIGIPASRFTDWDNQTHYFGYEGEGSNQIVQIAKRFALSNVEVDYLLKFIQYQNQIPHFRYLQGESLDRSIFRFLSETGDIGIDLAVYTLVEHLSNGSVDSDDQGGDIAKTVNSIFYAYWDRKMTKQKPLLSGEAVMSLLHVLPGTTVGKALDVLREEQAIGKITSVKDAEKLLKNWYSRTLLRDHERIQNGPD